MGYSRLLP